MAIADKHGRCRANTQGACYIEVNGNTTAAEPLRVAIFSASAIGYIENPEAIQARAMAWGLQQRGHHVRMLEERRNPALRRTLEVVGASASRQAFESFPGILIHSFEPRRGPQLMEWVARELSLVDLAVAIDGLPVELTRWIANLDHEKLVRAFVTYRPDELTSERAKELELERFDYILATEQPEAELIWQQLPPSIAPQDRAAIEAAYLPEMALRSAASPDQVAARLESLAEVVLRPPY